LSDPSGPLPGSSFYFLKRFGERVRLALSPTEREEVLKLELQEERLRELNKLIELGKTDGIAELDLRTDFGFLLSPDLEGIDDVGVREELAGEVAGQAAANHLILEGLLDQAPGEAELLIEEGMIELLRQLDGAADDLGREPLPEDLRVRLEYFKDMGCFTEEELSGIYALETRGEVRDELVGLVERGCLPTHDLRKLNEYPGIYTQEVAGRAELDKLEDLEAIGGIIGGSGGSVISGFGRILRDLPGVSGAVALVPSMVIHREELAGTARPDLINTAGLSGESQDLVNRYLEELKPTEEELRILADWKAENPDVVPPFDLQRIEHLREFYAVPAGDCGLCGGLAGIACLDDFYCDYGQGVDGVAKVTSDASGVCLKSDNSSKCVVFPPPVVVGEEELCGGLTGVICQDGLVCRYDGGRAIFPINDDEAGVCVKPTGDECLDSSTPMCFLYCRGGFERDDSGCPICKCADISLPRSSSSDEEACSLAGGAWKQFSNGCADFCGTGTMCTQATMYSCDCGDGKCWDGRICVGDDLGGTSASGSNIAPLLPPTDLPGGAGSGILPPPGAR
jgi:hypothetical protein